MQAGEIDLLVLDEFFAAYRTNLLDRALALQVVQSFPSQTELVLTGRDPDDTFLACADYISEIHAVRHPFERGIKARRGIEY